MTEPVATTIAALGRVFGAAATLLRAAGMQHEAQMLTRCTALPSSPCAQRTLDAVALTTRMHWGARGMKRTPVMAAALEGVALASAAFTAASVWPEEAPPSAWLEALAARATTLVEGRWPA